MVMFVKANSLLRAAADLWTSLTFCAHVSLYFGKVKPTTTTTTVATTAAAATTTNKQMSMGLKGSFLDTDVKKTRTQMKT